MSPILTSTVCDFFFFHCFLYHFWLGNFCNKKTIRTDFIYLCSEMYFTFWKNNEIKPGCTADGWAELLLTVETKCWRAFVMLSSKMSHNLKIPNLHIADSFIASYCFLKPCQCLYLWNKLFDLHRVFTKLKLTKYSEGFILFHFILFLFWLLLQIHVACSHHFLRRVAENTRATQNTGNYCISKCFL